MNSRITPSEQFPEDLGPLPMVEVEILNSKLHRELDFEYVHDGEPSPETESRLEEVTEELDRRDERAGALPPHVRAVDGADEDHISALSATRTFH